MIYEFGPGKALQTELWGSLGIVGTARVRRHRRSLAPLMIQCGCGVLGSLLVYAYPEVGGAPKKVARFGK